jgi:Astacin (Peptidase family M12A)
MSENESHYCMCITQGNLPPEAQAVLAQGRAAVMKNARWQPGAKIPIRFLSGSPELQRRVRTIAKEWETFANLTFQFVSNAPSDIRIAFFQDTRDDGSWSCLGTLCRAVAEPKPTMNFGMLGDAPTDRERRTVLHEFGHAIGLIHEHQNPYTDRPIAWNRAAVKADCSKPPNRWTDQQIEDNIFKPYNRDNVIATDRDPLSIMLYPIPKSWTLDGFSREMNRELSDEDKRLVKNVYPR